MSILLALGNEELSKGIRKLLVSSGLDVIEDEEVYHRNYLNDKIEMLSPSMVIIHDIYLESDFGHSKETAEQRDNEMLELIEYWRTTYDSKLRVVYLCVRERQDEFIGQLIARNVLDIFNGLKVRNEQFVQQLSEPARYVNVKSYGISNIKAEYLDKVDEEETENTSRLDATNHEDLLEEKEPVPTKEKREIGKKITQTLKVGVSSGVHVAGKVATGTGTLVKGAAEKIPKRTESSPKKEEPDVSDLMMEDLLDLMPVDIEVAQRVKPAIIGTVLIAVAGVRPHMGSTHTALSISSYLANLGHSVAVIENNYSQDFERIHSLYEGSKEFLKKESYFEIDQVHHYKYRDNVELNELYPLYEYVVIDYGDLEEAPGYIEEFKRAHVRCVLCSADEWKQHWIDSFLKQNKLSKDECVFLVPASSDEKVNDLTERINYKDIFAFPPQDNPYEPSKEMKDIIYQVLGSFIKAPNKAITKNTLIISCIITAAVVVAVVMTFTKL